MKKCVRYRFGITISYTIRNFVWRLQKTKAFTRLSCTPLEHLEHCNGFNTTKSKKKLLM